MRVGTISEVRDRCSRLKEHLSARDVLESEIAPFWRKGKARDLMSWITSYAGLSRLAGKYDREDRAEKSVATSDRDVLDALRIEPMPVRLLRPIRDGTRVIEIVHVRPKSLDAMLHIAALEEQLAHLLDLRSRLDESGRPSADVADKLADGISYCYQLLCWTVTTGTPESDAAMPYPADEPAPAVPSWLASLDAWDVVRICKAVGHVNSRLAAITALIDPGGPEEGGKRPSWSRLMGTLAIELSTPASTLTKLYSLHELLASIQFSNDSKAPVETAK